MNNIKELYQGIYNTYVKQQKILEEERWEELEEGLNERQKLMEQLAGKEIPLELKEEITDLLQKSLTLHNKLQQKMETSIQENRLKRQQLIKGKEVYQRYQQSSSHSLFLDRKK